MNVLGTRVVIPWESLTVGDSVFVPCVDTKDARLSLVYDATKMGIIIEMHDRIESGRLGVRFWVMDVAYRPAARRSS